MYLEVPRTIFLGCRQRWFKPLEKVKENNLSGDKGPIHSIFVTNRSGRITESSN